MTKDLSQIAAALAPSAGASTPILVTSSKQAVSLAMAAPRDLWSVFVSPTLAAGTVIGLIPAALATIVEVPRLEASNKTTVQFANPASADLLAGAPVASTFQSDKIALKLIMPATWAVRSPTAVAWLTTTKW